MISFETGGDEYNFGEGAELGSSDGAHVGAYGLPFWNEDEAKAVLSKVEGAKTGTVSSWSTETKTSDSAFGARVARKRLTMSSYSFHLSPFIFSGDAPAVG